MIDKMERAARSIVEMVTFEAVERQNSELISPYFILVLSREPESLAYRVLENLKIIQEDFDDAIPDPDVRMFSGKPLPGVGVARALSASLLHATREGRMYITPDDLLVGMIQDPQVIQMFWQLGAELTPGQIMEQVTCLV